jgi:hypothetical protein
VGKSHRPLETVIAGKLTLQAVASAGIGFGMRPLFFFWLMMAGCLEAKPFHWPWNSRATEQQRLNAATAPKPTSREAEILRADETKAFNLSSAKFGTGVSVTGKKTATSEFQFVDRTRTKSFATKELFSKPAWGAGSAYETKAVPTKESWFARVTASTKAFLTRESSDANKNLQGGVLPGSEKKFLARGRRQAELDADRAEGRAPKVPIGEDRDGGQSWSGDVKPLTIQDVKALLNKN